MSIQILKNPGMKDPRLIQVPLFGLRRETANDGYRTTPPPTLPSPMLQAVPEGEMGKRERKEEEKGKKSMPLI